METVQSILNRTLQFMHSAKSVCDLVRRHIDYAVELDRAPSHYIIKFLSKASTQFVMPDISFISFLNKLYDFS